MIMTVQCSVHNMRTHKTHGRHKKTIDIEIEEDTFSKATRNISEQNNNRVAIENWTRKLIYFRPVTSGFAFSHFIYTLYSQIVFSYGMKTPQTEIDFHSHWFLTKYTTNRRLDSTDKLYSIYELENCFIFKWSRDFRRQ